MTESWGAAVFDRLYAADPDPWRFATSPYEREKYAATLALLPEARRFASGLELGCSIGVFTASLAPHCDTLLAVDCAEAALAQARASVPEVRFERHVLPASFPAGTFDLIVISELLYFLSPADLDALAACATRALRPDAVVLLANWTGATNTPCDGETAASHFIAAAPSLRLDATRRAESYRLDRLVSAIA